LPFVYTVEEKNQKNAIEKVVKMLYNKFDKTKRRANAVTFDRFLPDYGVLPSAYFDRTTITNPIELFWSDDLCALLRLCGAKEEMIGERASDYDRFCALCMALPLLEGHPTRAWIASVLESFFNLKEIPTGETAPVVWKNLCQTLLENPILAKELVSGAWLCDALTLPRSIPEYIEPVLNANLLLQTNAKTAALWSSEISSAVVHFVQKGCQKIVFEMGKGFDFVIPSLYHVDRALSIAKKDHEAKNLLTCQLMRELCVIAQEKDLLLVLACDGNSSAVANLLQYCKDSVGLPRICWSVREAREAYTLLDFTAQANKNEIFAALAYENIMTQKELFDTLESWQVRYPIGRLCFLTVRDLRQTPHAQEHITNMLEKLKTNI
jgi:hypothetical protein